MSWFHKDFFKLPAEIEEDPTGEAKRWIKNRSLELSVSDGWKIEMWLQDCLTPSMDPKHPWCECDKQPEWFSEGSCGYEGGAYRQFSYEELEAFRDAINKTLEYLKEQ